MKLYEYMSLRGMRADAMDGRDWYETVIGLRPHSNSHPPSLKNPQHVKIPMAQDGWERGAGKKAREQAKKDLMETLRRSVTQIGKPVVSHTAKYPVFPMITDWQ